MRPIKFPTKKVLPKDHFLNFVPGGYDKKTNLISRNCQNLIEAKEYVNDEPYQSSFTFLHPDAESPPLTNYQKHILTTNMLHYTSLYLKWAGGAGKTRASIYWAMHKFDEQSKLLIITTAGAKRQWASEVLRTTTLFPVIIDVQEHPLDTNQQVYVINWDLIAPMEDKLTAWLASGKSVIILDEIHYAKAWKRVKQEISADTGELTYEPLTTRAAVAARLCRKSTRRIGLSATPYSVSLIDLWGQLDDLEPDCWGKYSEFAFRYCDAHTGEFGGLVMNGASNLGELKDRLNTILHSISRKELEEALPGKSRELMRLHRQDLNAPFKNALQYIKLKAQEGDDETFWEAQIAVAASMKRDWAIAQVKDALDAGLKVTILTNRREEVEVLEKALCTSKTRAKQILASHGGVSLEIREEQRVRYRDSEEPLCLIGTHEAWGVSIDGLQSTDVAIMLALPYTPRTLGQSETRFVRKGQTRRCRIIYPIAEGTIDELVNERLLGRLDTLKDLLEGEEESDEARKVLAGFGDLEEYLNTFALNF